MHVSPIVTGAVVQFGGHFAKNIAPLKAMFSDDPAWTITASEWASFQSSVTLPCIFFPWIFGRTVDSEWSQTKPVLVLALAIVCIGQAIFTIAVKDHMLHLAFGGRFIMGIGEGLVSSLAGYIASMFAPGHRMLSIGIIQACHALAVASSKAVLAPVSLMFGSYVASLWLTLLVCCLSLLGGLLWYVTPGSKEVREQQRKHCARPGAPRTKRNLSVDFWIIALIHLLFSSAHRLFGHIDAPFLSSAFGHSVSGAGFASSVTEFVAVVVSPILGAILDNYCTTQTLPLLALAAAVTGAVGYGMLAFTGGHLPVALVMIGMVNGVTPTVMKSMIPECVHWSALATAFGIYESSESLGIVVGSLTIGLAAERLGDDYSRIISVFPVLLLVATALTGFLVFRRIRRSRRRGHALSESSDLLSAYMICPSPR